MERLPRPEWPDNAETICDAPAPGRRLSPVPERIGAYRVEGRLGLGGMGEVFLAWDERLERRVAIKRIRREAGLSPEQRERFRREARLAARLSHSAVVQIHDLISDGADDAIVMELVEGRTVEERLAVGRLETAEILRLAQEIAEGLAAAHEAGLVHRDLKAANVIITRSGHAKILDFGLARPKARAPEDQGFTRQGVILGTCHAMSPEQARGEEVDERSDLFSFGALVHEMLTGRPPFRGNDPIDSLRRVVTETPVDPYLARPDLPAEAVSLLRRLLAKNRDDRPASAREVIEILERLRTAPSGPQPMAKEESVSELVTGGATALELPVPFRGEAGGSRPVRWPRRILLAGVAVVLLVAGAFALFLMTRSQSALPVSSKDLEALKEIEQRLDNGDKLLDRDGHKMEAILQRNPRSVEPRILMSRIQLSVYESWRDSDFLDRALELAQQANALAPDKPEPLIQELSVTFEYNDSPRAEALLQKIDARWPSHLEILPLRARLEEQRGHWEDAARLRREVVARNPSWQNRYRLALLEARRGRLQEAREQIEIILAQEPGNPWAQEQLGHIELMYGDLGRAVQIYTGLLDAEPRRALNNLGQAHVLSGNYQKAAEVFRSALEKAPGHPLTLINLADAEVELGRMISAGSHYHRALELLDQQAEEGPRGLTPREQMLRAQCLARLGDNELAVKAAQAALIKNAGNPELLQQSALVYSLVGDREAALENAQAALERGLRKRWFSGSALSELRKKLDESPEPATSGSAADPPEDRTSPG